MTMPRTITNPGVTPPRRKHLRIAAILIAAAAMVATSMTTASAVLVTNPCTATITWANSTSTKVANGTCSLAFATITRYYAGGPVTYSSNGIPPNASRTVTSTNGSCISHGATLYVGTTGTQKDYSC